MLYDGDTGKEEHIDFKVKIMFIGNSSVGKTSIIKRYSKNIFSTSYISTLGIDFESKNINIDNKIINLQIWDTAGQEKYKVLSKNYYNNSNAFIIVYDITNLESFESVMNWIDQIKENAPENVKSILLGNKSDLEEKRKVTYQEGKDFATSNGMQFIETSAKTASKVQEAFELLTQEIIKASVTKDRGMEKKEKSVHLSSGVSDLSTKQKGGCC